MTTNFTYEQFKDVVNKYLEYFRELEDLKEAGIDLSKLDAHSTLYKIAIETLFEEVGVECGMEILQYAKFPITDIKEYYEYLNKKYKFNIEKSKVDTFGIKESSKVETKKTSTKREDKSSKKENKVHYVLNGREVSEEEYRELYNKWRQILEFYNRITNEELSRFH